MTNHDTRWRTSVSIGLPGLVIILSSTLVVTVGGLFWLLKEQARDHEAVMLDDGLDASGETKNVSEFEIQSPGALPTQAGPDERALSRSMPPVGALEFEAVALSPTEIRLRWKGVPPGVAARVERLDMERGIWTVICDIDGGEGDSFTDNGVMPGHGYHYRLITHNRFGEGAEMLASCGTPLPDAGGAGIVERMGDDIPPPPAPRGFFLVKQPGLVDSSPLYTFQWTAINFSFVQMPLPFRTYRVYANDTPLADTGGGNTFTLDPTTLHDGNHALSVVVVDTAGRESLRSESVLVRVNPELRATKMVATRELKAAFQVKTLAHDAIATGFSPNDVAWDKHAALERASGRLVLSTLRPDSSPEVAMHRLANGGPVRADGEYRVVVTNHDQRARRVKFVWVEVFIPLGKNGAPDREAARSLAVRECTLTLAPGDRAASSETFKVKSPEEPGTVYLGLMEPFGISATPVGGD
ncbi:MAG: hypothetical protein LBI02_07940 [Opitutaceae bacterium]|nr:hypothetical protein [Opitutaceae bacterium]